MPKPAPANYIAYTSPINPPSAHPRLTLPQVWAGLQLKIRSAESFVPGAIKSTHVLSESTDPHSGLPVVEREILFSDGERRVKETCKSFEAMKVEFGQPNGSLVCNIISDGAGAHSTAEEGTDLYMTYTFEWLHEGMGAEELEGLREKERKMAKQAVESTIVAMREMVRDGRIKA